MKLIVGLGNPGAGYEGTRHNAGFMVVDRLLSVCASQGAPRVRFKALASEVMLAGPAADDRVDPMGLPAAKCLVMKPTTFMNLSGEAVAEAVRFYKLDPAEDVLVIVDELALPAGVLRMRARGSAGGHNGLTSIGRLLGTDGYARLRVGIDGPGRVPQADYVLGKFAPEQREAVEAALPRAVAAVALWANEGVDAAMNRYNVKEGGKGQGGKKQEGEERGERAGVGGGAVDGEDRGGAEVDGGGGVGGGDVIVGWRSGGVRGVIDRLVRHPRSSGERIEKRSD